MVRGPPAVMGCGTSQKAPAMSDDAVAEAVWARLQEVARSSRSQSRHVEDVRHAPTHAPHETLSDRPFSGPTAAFELPASDLVDGGLFTAHVNDKRIQTILENLGEGEVFFDADFPAENKSLFYRDHVPLNNVVWRRPKDLVPEPFLLHDGVSRHDIIQGILGDCWFLSSCAAVACREDLMARVIPSDQPLFGDGYKGVVTFRFWRFGEWVTVVVDDQLPTKDSQLLYARCSDRNEFWVALLEKAYAKLHGCYEAIEGGQAMDALVDLTSGLAERYDLNEADSSLFDHLLRASLSGAFVTCSRKGDWKMAHFADKNGLISGHAYSISSVVTVQVISGKTENLLRIRNPWGNETEWKGLWSDGSNVWDTLDAEAKDRIDYVKENDGEFWMNFNDFCNEFEEVSICTLGPDFDRDGVADRVGQVKGIRGSWVFGQSCGGSRNDFVKFATNPQYLLTLTDPALMDPDRLSSLTMTSKCSVVIALMQEHKRSEYDCRTKMLQIGFVLYKTKDPFHRLMSEYFMYHYDKGSSGTYINYREIFGRFELEAGYYVIIPATFEPECPGNFLIRVYASHPFGLRELSAENTSPLL